MADPKRTSSSSSSSALGTFLCSLLVSSCLLASSTSYASQRSIQLDGNGFYKGLVISFSSDFHVSTKEDRVILVQSIMAAMQNTSDILNHMLGVQFGEVTIVLPDEWNILDSDMLTSPSVTKSQYDWPLQESDIIFTEFTDPNNNDKEQILTMQYGECGEGALPINFPKMYISDVHTPRLLAHQWLLYRYGVFNEFGYLNDSNYPVYFTPVDGGAFNRTGPPSINSCSNNPEFNNFNQCQDVSTDPNTGLPVNPSCDIIPVDNSIYSSFLYAPLQVSEYALCNKSTHDYLSPNKQNVFCDYQSPHDVITKHTDFDNFKPQAVPNQSTGTVQFRIVEKKSNQGLKGRILYAFPFGFRFSTFFTAIISKLSSSLYLYQHQAKLEWYNSNKLDNSLAQEWKPSSNLPEVTPTGTITDTINIVSILEQVIEEFSSNDNNNDNNSFNNGVCLLVFSGNFSIQSNTIDYEIQLEQLANRFNSANVALRVVIVDQMPSKTVLDFFEKLNTKLNTKSTVTYAFVTSTSPSSSVALRTQIFSNLNTALFDILADVTDQSHILLKRETFRSTENTVVNFTIDKSLSQSNTAASDRLFVFDIYTSSDASQLLQTIRLKDKFGKQIYNYWMKSEKDAKYISVLFQGDHMTEDFYTFSVQPPTTEKSIITVSVRVLSKRNSFRSYHRETPVTARCWLRTDSTGDMQYPMRGYVQVSQGLNGPVYDADVSLIVRRYTLNEQQEINIPLSDNGRGNPDLTARDGIYSAYLDQIFPDLTNSNTEYAFSVTARIVSLQSKMKPANFGNTVMFKNKLRCCGSDLMVKTDDVKYSTYLERLVDCGSFYRSQQKHDRYAIRDLRLTGIVPDNRTVTLKWNSPFVSATTRDTAAQSKQQSNSYEIKAFHSYAQHSDLPRYIKENFANAADTKLEILPVLPEQSELEQNSPMQNYAQYSQLFKEIQYELLKSSPAKAMMSNSLREVTVRIVNNEEGYYFLVVQERDGIRKSMPSNVVPVHLKSNVPIENTTALAIDDSDLSEGPYRESLGSAGLQIWQIVIIILASVLLLFVAILIIICCINKKKRKTNKEPQTDYEVKKASPIMEQNDGKSNGGVDSRQPSYYLNQDASSLISNERGNALPNSNVSNNTSCSSVNTVDHPSNGGIGVGVGGGSFMTPSSHHMDGNHHLDHPTHIGSVGSASITPPGSHSTKMMKELNVATLLPNSWDAKELLDHWGRVQEAKQRQESPPVVRTIRTSSPSIPSYGSSSLENYNQHSYLCQPATVQKSAGHQYSQPEHVSGLVSPPGDYHHPIEYHQHHHQQPSVYSPYSNASSIWQHHQQQQQQQQQQQPRTAYGHGPPVLHHPGYAASSYGYDDNGLPEYSVVRKHPNVSQV